MSTISLVQPTIAAAQSPSPAESALLNLSQAIACDYYTGAIKIPELSLLLEVETSRPYSSIIENTPDTPAAKAVLHSLIREYQAMGIGIVSKQISERPDCILPLLMHLRHPQSQIGRYGLQLFLKNAGNTLSQWLALSGLSESETDSASVAAKVQSFSQANPLETCWRSIYLAERFPNTQISTSATLMMAHTLAAEGKNRQALLLLETSRRKNLQEGLAVQVICEIARLHTQLGKPDKALKAWEDIEIFYPQSPSAPLAMEEAAAIEHLLGNQQKAFVRLQRLGSAYPTYQIADSKLQQFREKYLQTLDERITSLQAVIDENKDSHRELALKELANLIRSVPLPVRLYQRVATANPGTDLGSLAKALSAQAFLRDRQAQQAIDIAQEIIEQENAGREVKLIAYQTIGDALRSQGNFSQAFEQYSAGCLLFPEEHPLKQLLLTRPGRSPALTLTDDAEMRVYCELLRGYLLLARDLKPQAVGSLRLARQLWENSPARPEKQNSLDDIDFLLLFCNVQMQRYDRIRQGIFSLTKQLAGEANNQAQFVRKILELRKIGTGYLEHLSTYESVLEASKQLPNVQAEAISFYNSLAASISLPGKLDGRDQLLVGLLVSAERGGILKDADDKIQELLDKWPDSPQVVRLLDALYIVWFGQVDRLEQLLEKRTQLPETMQTKASLVDLAQLALKVNQTRLADNLLEKAAETADVQTLQAIAKIYLGFNRYADGIECYRRILAKYPQDSRCPSTKLEIAKLYAEQWKLYPQAIKECEELIEQFEQTPQAVEAAFMIGRICYTNQQYQAAVDRLTHFVQQYPDHQLAVQAKLLRGLSYLADGDSEQAVKGFGQLVGEHPEDPAAAQAQFLIGYTYLSEQKYNLAAEELQRLLDRYPKCTYAARAKELIQRLSNINQTSPGD